LLYTFFWVISRRLNSDAGELPRRKHTKFRRQRKFESKKKYSCIQRDSTGRFICTDTELLCMGPFWYGKIGSHVRMWRGPRRRNRASV